MAAALCPLPKPSPELMATLEAVYTDLHANPELCMREDRTAGIAAAWMKAQGYDVTEGVGVAGVVGLLRNGDGATVLLRADRDGLPIKERTGLTYASDKTGTGRYGSTTSIAHACGHDMHVTWMMGAAHLLAEMRDKWHGTVMVVFQPGQETAEGAHVMIGDGMVKRFPKPDVTLAEHVMPLSAGKASYRVGTILSAGDSWEVKLFGCGAHRSMPEKSIDPVVMASAVVRLQTVVSREVAMTDDAVPLTRNDEAATRKVAAALEARFGSEHMQEIRAPFSASEDFNLFVAAWGTPAVFWVVGGIDPNIYAEAEKAGKLNELPVNHATGFAPVINPTLLVGIEAILAAASVWLVGQGL